MHPSFDTWYEVYVHRIPKSDEHRQVEFRKADNYEICFLDTSQGCIIRNRATQRIVTPYCAKSGTRDPSYTLCLDKKPIKYLMTHIMLASSNPEHPPDISTSTVDHIDDDYTNNNIRNLRWLSASENSRKLSHCRPRKEPICIDVPNDEEWAPFTLDGGKTIYNVSKYGRLKSPSGSITIGNLLRGHKVRQYNIRYIEKGVPLNKKFYVHMLVWLAFGNARPEKGQDIMHDDTAPLIADGSYRNWLCDLSLGSRSENMKSFHQHKGNAAPKMQTSSPSAVQTTTFVAQQRPRYSERSSDLEMPTGFWVQAPYKNKGAVVVVEIKRAKKNNASIYWKSPSSTSLSIRFKIEVAKKFVRWVLQNHPDLAPYCDRDAYNEDLYHLTDNEREELEQFTFKPHHDPFVPRQDSQRKSSMKCSLPRDCGVTEDIIPKYVYYRPATDTRGDGFVIDGHPSLLARTGKRTWNTTQSRGVTTKTKFDLVVKQLQSFDNPIPTSASNVTNIPDSSPSENIAE